MLKRLPFLLFNLKTISTNTLRSWKKIKLNISWWIQFWSQRWILVSFILNPLKRCGNKERSYILSLNVLLPSSINRLNFWYFYYHENANKISTSKHKNQKICIRYLPVQSQQWKLKTRCVNYPKLTKKDTRAISLT